MSSALIELQARLRDVHNLQAAAAVLDWDQQTYMPRGGVGARAEQKATLARLHHELLASAQTGELLHLAAEELGRGTPAVMRRRWCGWVSGTTNAPPSCRRSWWSS